MHSVLETILAIKESIQQGKNMLTNKGVYAELETLKEATNNANIWSDTKRANQLFANLKAVRTRTEPLEELYKKTCDMADILKDTTEEEASMFTQEVENIIKEWSRIETSLYLGGEFDANNCYITISSGAGGTEAQDWAAMLARMYTRYAERQSFTVSLIEETPGQEAGIKSVTFLLQGTMAYGYLRCERGTHRLVRLSPFNAKNLRQTSFALVEVLPEILETSEIEINPSDLRIDTYRSGGAGGQHVNKTDSAVRITHIPTGIAVACQSERSQLQNRMHAMNMLSAKLLEKKRAEEQSAKQELKGATKSADFGQQIRSYVLHPYQMVKDMRTDVETSDTVGVLDGDLQEFINAELKRSAGSI